MRTLLLLIRKDLALEVRSREVIALAIGLALLLSVIAAFGIGSGFLEQRILAVLYPVFIWLIFLFTTTISLGKTLDHELSDGALDALITARVAFPALYLSKVIANVIFATLGHATAVVVLAAFMNVSLTGGLLPFLWVSLGVIVAYSALATMLVALSSMSRLRGLLLPLLLLPLAAPLFFCAIELTREALSKGTLAFESPWVSLLIGLNVVYLLAGINLYEPALRE